MYAAVAAYIGLGTNLGDRRSHLMTALRGLGRLGRIDAVSTVYETDPVGPPQPVYWNAVVRLATTRPPATLLAALHDIEAATGRTRSAAAGPRTMDLDLLLYDELVLATERLTVPHPRLAERRFVLVPLLEIAPDLTDPRDGRALREALVRAADAPPRPLFAGGVLLDRPR
jgi:2-amino-4-hydroxy-6-hydroxymethyldihydropteridine diphosphokinase